MEPFASLDQEKFGAVLKNLAGTGKITPGFAKDLGVLLQSLSGQHLNTVTELSGQDIFTSALTVTWPLFTGGRIQAAEQIAEE